MFGPWRRTISGIGYESNPGGKWVVVFPGVREVFEDWQRGHAFLLTELQYMALDAESEALWQAWDEVRLWRPNSDKFSYSVTVGDPPGTYRLVRYGHEAESRGL